VRRNAPTFSPSVASGIIQRAFRSHRLRDEMRLRRERSRWARSPTSFHSYFNRNDEDDVGRRGYSRAHLRSRPISYRSRFLMGRRDSIPDTHY